jgi:hypothetical protein
MTSSTARAVTRPSHTDTGGPMSTFDTPSTSSAGRDDESLEQSRVAARVPALRPLSPVPTYLGVAVAALGFALIAVAWGKVAGQTNVGLQMPYLVSGGLTGLALVMVGVTIISVAAKRRDALLREKQMRLLVDALDELSGALDRSRRP